jgi:hypothetical protein
VSGHMCNDSAQFTTFGPSTVKFGNGAVSRAIGQGRCSYVRHAGLSRCTMCFASLAADLIFRPP